MSTKMTPLTQYNLRTYKSCSSYILASYTSNSNILFSHLFFRTVTTSDISTSRFFSELVLKFLPGVKQSSFEFLLKDVRLFNVKTLIYHIKTYIMNEVSALHACFDTTYSIHIEHTKKIVLRHRLLLHSVHLLHRLYYS